MRTRRRYEESENASWPGLVDLFAFGMVIMLVMWMASAAADPPEGPSTGSEAGAPDDPLLSKGRDVARQVQEALAGGLQHTDIVPKPDLPGLEIRSFQGREIYFRTGAFDLSPADEEAVGQLGEVVAAAIQEQRAVFVKVNGTADPRPLGQLVPPRDNVELSALRAAAVSKILVLAGLRDRLTVVGLGEIGDLRTASTEAELREFRKVYLTLEVRLDLLRNQPGTNGRE